MSDADRKRAMRLVNLIKEKRDGVIKGRTYTDRSKRKEYLNPDELVSSPTISTDALFVSFIL